MSYGNGIGLDEDFDIIVDGTGDIRAFIGEEELSKDIAYIVSSRLNFEIGKSRTATTLAGLKSIIRNQLNRDPRVQKITNISAEEIAEGYEFTISLVAFEENNVPETFTVEVTQ